MLKLQVRYEIIIIFGRKKNMRPLIKLYEDKNDIQK